MASPSRLTIPPRAGNFATRVLVVDGDPSALSGICRALEDAGAVVIARAASSWEGVELARVNSPDVAFITDGLDGVAAIDEVIALGLGIRLLLLTNACDAAVDVAAIRAGARGYLTREPGSSSPSTLGWSCKP